MGDLLVYGGTFDPPHVGHLAAVRAAVAATSPSEVRVIVAGDPWTKRRPDLTSAAVRAALTAAAFADQPVTVDLSEIAHAAEGHPSYTTVTLERLRTCGHHRPLLLVGSDLAPQMHRWHDHQRLARLARLLILRRPDPHTLIVPTVTQIRATLPAPLRRDAQVITDPSPPVSSTALRRMITDNDPQWRTLIPTAAAQIIDHLNLYAHNTMTAGAC